MLESLFHFSNKPLYKQQQQPNLPVMFNMGADITTMRLEILLKSVA
jgi:hypothetical protein